jgi:ribonucleoside-triphosphate reductase
MAEIKLSRDFIESYPEFPAHQDAIGKFTYLRTYSRYLASKSSREVLRDTGERATRYSINLERKHREENGLPIDEEKMEAELKKLFHNVVNLKQWLSGRTMWVGGADTGVAEKYPTANFNCSFTLIEDYEDMVEAFYLLMVGVGVGFKSIEETCEKLPPIRNDFKIRKLPYMPVPKNRRSDDTYLKHVNGHTLMIRVGDSKEGKLNSHCPL